MNDLNEKMLAALAALRALAARYSQAQQAIETELRRPLLRTPTHEK